MLKSVRLRLLVLAMLPLVLLLPILLTITMTHWADRFDGLLISKVASDLRIAEQYMQRIVTTQGNQISGLAASTAFRNADQAGQAQLNAFLETSRDQLGLDYLALRRDHPLPPESSIVTRAQADGTATAIEIFTQTDLAAISDELTERARITLIETQAAIPTERNIEGRGMVVLGATEVQVGGKSAVLIGGTLLNQNLHFIDTINDLVYPDDSGKTGTATLFLEDVRISTNVRLFENVRALGTRVSEVVYRRVLDQGSTWLNRAFVVNDWYISGYLPIVDGQQKRIGMLYVGFLERPFAALKTNIYLALISAFIVIIVISVPFFLWLAQGIFSPLEEMDKTMRRVESGTLDARIPDIKSKDEIGQVARHLNALLDQVQERDQKLRGWADTLNDKVDRRTEELRDSNEKLEQTYKQLVVSEKLASIGEITAGVAHEINNPVAVIQGNLDVMRMALGSHATEYATELDLIDDQVRRINSIVGKLLQFAKPGDFVDSATRLDVGKVLKDSLVLVRHSLIKSDIKLTENFRSAPMVLMDQGELQQVLVNLLINAIQAMPDGGELSLEVMPAKHDGMAGTNISIKDTGTGISPQKLGHIFDPFFTTKLGQGTGLGLSISQSLIQRSGGCITANSKVGRGSHFFVWLPEAPKLSAM